MEYINHAPSINIYFKDVNRLENAIQAYVHNTPWPVSDKARLYDFAKFAFDPTKPQKQREQNFGKIYQDLITIWNIRRGGKLLEAEEIFSILNSLDCQACLAEKLDLVSLQNEPSDIDTLIGCIDAIKDIKHITGDSPMALSKILHFFNPKLFPIYDKYYIKDMVMRAFKDDFNIFQFHFLISHKNLQKEVHPRVFKYLTFLLWVNHIFQANRDNIPQCTDYFARWFCNKLKEENYDKEKINDIRIHIVNYYATLFEFVAIGAAFINKLMPQPDKVVLVAKGASETNEGSSELKESGQLVITITQTMINNAHPEIQRKDLNFFPPSGQEFELETPEGRILRVYMGRGGAFTHIHGNIHKWFRSHKFRVGDKLKFKEIVPKRRYRVIPC